jgi:hypothetical protein
MRDAVGGAPPLWTRCRAEDIGNLMGKTTARHYAGRLRQDSRVGGIHCGPGEQGPPQLRARAVGAVLGTRRRHPLAVGNRSRACGLHGGPATGEAVYWSLRSSR